MGELGELLELLFKARRSWTSVQASMRQWSHRERSTQAFLRYAQDLHRAGGIMTARGTAPHEHDPPLPEEEEWTAQVWLAPTDRVHVEYAGTGVVPIRRSVRSVNGRPVAVRQDNPLQDLLDPVALVSGLDLTVSGRAEVAERRVVVAEGELRKPEVRRPVSFHGLAPGADSYVLSVDVERGVLLRTEARFAGEPFAITEVTAISFDAELPDELFAAPRPGEEPFPRPQAVTIEEAARLAPFTVLVPTRVPQGSTLFVRVMPAMGPRPFTVSLSYHLPAALHHLQVTELAEPDDARDGMAWSREDHGGERLWVWEPSEELAGAQRQVKIVRDGTSVRFISDLDLGTLREVARSLVPAPTDPPALA